MRLKASSRQGVLFALLATMMLGGCATSGERVIVAPAKPLPEAPAELAQTCPDPGVRAGKPALSELARNRVALAQCRDRHERLVTFYGEVKRGRDGNE